MHRKLEIEKYLRIFLISYIAFLVMYLTSGGGLVLNLGLLAIEDFLLPIGAFSLGVKFTKRKVFWLSFFVIVGVFSRIVGKGDMYEIGLSTVILIPYIFGGYFYRTTKSKYQLFVSLILVNAVILMIPDISLPMYLTFLEEKRELMSMVNSFTGLQYIVSSWLLAGLENWGYALELFEKLVIGFFVMRVYLKFARVFDYSLDLSFFHRKYGAIVLVLFMINLMLKILGYNGVFQYSIVLFALYFFITGAVSIFEMAKLSKVLRRSIYKQFIPYLWLGSLVFISFDVSFYTIIITLIYSAYISTIGKNNVARLISDTIKRIKGV